MDAVHEWTDGQLEDYERKIAKVYRQAAKEMQAKHARAMSDFQKEKEQRLKAMDDTPEARREYQQWLSSQTARAQWMRDMALQLTRGTTEAKKKAVALIHDYIPGVYAENANWAAYSVDRAAKVDTMFTLVDEDTVHELAKGDRTLLPEVNVPKDTRWNMQKFTSAITQGILQGESIPDMAKRLESVIGRSYKTACGAARLAMTCAENRGRVSSYERAQRLGISLKQEWLATLDARTRPSHRACDGEKVAVGETFSCGCKYPGDPDAPGEEIWGCRCTLIAAVDGIDDEGERWSKLPEGMTYEEWKAEKRSNAIDKRPAQRENNDRLNSVQAVESMAKTITIDDVADAIYYSEIRPEVGEKVFEVIKANENPETHFIQEVRVAQITDENGHSVAMQTEPIASGRTCVSRLVLNEDVLGGLTVGEIDAMFAKSRTTVANSLEEAVVHEIGHAKVIHGRTVDEIRALYAELSDKGIDGISLLASGDGVEAVAEIEVLLRRGGDISDEAARLYNETMRKEPR